MPSPFKIKRVIKKDDGAIKEIKIAEATILTHILGWFLVNNYLAWRNNSGAIRTMHGRFVRLSPPGSPDIIAVDKETGRFIGVEVKRKGTYQNDNQKMFQKKLTESNAIYIVARSTTDVIDALTLH